MPSRPPSSIVQAVLANLEWAADVSEQQIAGGQTYEAGESNAYRQSIALIRTEFAEYLEAAP